MLVARPPIHTGQPTSLQPKFRGPLVVSEVLPNDAYRLIQLEGSGKRKYTVTAHCSQMRWYRVHGEETDVLPLDHNDVEIPEKPLQNEEPEKLEDDDMDVDDLSMLLEDKWRPCSSKENTPVKRRNSKPTVPEAPKANRRQRTGREGNLQRATERKEPASRTPNWRTARYVGKYPK